MSKPIVAVDIDEVLSPFVPGLTDWHNRQYGTALKVDDFHTYEFHKIWGGTVDTAISKSAAYFESREPVPPLDDALSVLSRLQQNYEFIVVTSRMLLHKTQTEAWIREHFPGIFKEIVICNHWTLDKSSPRVEKSAACIERGIEILIDDSPKYIEDVSAKGMTGLLFGDYPWNRRITDHPRIARVHNWAAVENYLNIR